MTHADTTTPATFTPDTICHFVKSIADWNALSSREAEAGLLCTELEAVPAAVVICRTARDCIGMVNPAHRVVVRRVCSVVLGVVDDEGESDLTRVLTIEHEAIAIGYALNQVFPMGEEDELPNVIGLIISALNPIARDGAEPTAADLAIGLLKDIVEDIVDEPDRSVAQAEVVGVLRKHIAALPKAA